MKNDRLFADKKERIGPFEFDDSVANCFDDMILRSVPLYEATQQLAVDLVRRSLPENGLLVDLGCSTGNTLHRVLPVLREKNSRAIGVEFSLPMLERCQQRFSTETDSPVSFVHSDLRDYECPKSDFYSCLYTLQFLPPDVRRLVVARISNALPAGGVFFVGEKIRFDDPEIEEIAEQGYYDFKRRNGYSEMEILQKKKALENVLHPFTLEQNREMFFSAGFSKVEVVQFQYLFATYLVKK